MMRPQIKRILRRQMSTDNTSAKSIDYCINLVKKRSHEQYLATLLLPENIRRVGFVIRAFNVEIATIRDQVTARHAGMGRMVFWRELIQNLFEHEKPVPNHPVARELNSVISQVLERPLKGTQVFTDVVHF